MKAILPVLIFTAIINIFYGDGGTVLLEVWRFTITTSGLYRSFFMALRIALLIFVSSALTYTTTPNDLTDGIESLLSPLKFLGLKNAVHTLAMMMTIALRFIPTLIEEAEKIMNAQKARGADIESGGLISRVKALIPILIPLLISSVRRASELAEAMECRCYNGGEGRVRMKQLKYSIKDGRKDAVIILSYGEDLTRNLKLIERITEGMSLGEPAELLGRYKGKYGIGEEYIQAPIYSYTQTRLIYTIPSRGLIGFTTDFMTMTKGYGILNHTFSEYKPAYDLQVGERKFGVLVSMENGKATAYSIGNLEDRGIMFIEPGCEVYEGMIVGECNL